MRLPRLLETIREKSSDEIVVSEAELPPSQSRSRCVLELRQNAVARRVSGMSALPPKADILGGKVDVRRSRIMLEA